MLSLGVLLRRVAPIFQIAASAQKQERLRERSGSALTWSDMKCQMDSYGEQSTSFGRFVELTSQKGQGND